jgi:oligoendopeptidase F
MTSHTETLHRWDLSGLYTGPEDPAIERELDGLRAIARPARLRYQGQLSTLTPEDLRALIVQMEAIATGLIKLRTYASLAFWVDTRDTAFKALYDRIRVETADIEIEARFFDVELKHLPEDARKRFLASEALASYRYYLERIDKAAPHSLGEAQERVMGIKNLTGVEAWVQLYTEITASMQIPLRLGNETRTVSLSEAKSLRADADREVREEATRGVLAAFEARGHVLSYLYNTVYEDHRQTCQLRGYDDPMAPTLLGEDLEPEVIEALLGAVEDHYGLARRYYRSKARVLGLKDFSSHDIFAPQGTVERPIPYEEARRIVLDSFKSFSPVFHEMAQGFFDHGYIDVPPAPGKQGGAFCARMAPGLHPYILLNYTEQLTDVSALAHELGHGIHFMLGGLHRTHFNYYPIPPFAETASTFAELLTVNRLLELETDPDVRRQLLASRVESAIFTIMLQVVNTRWEQRAHAARSEGVVAPETFCALWEEENRKLFGDAVKRGPDDRWGWATISHMLQFRFYCYSYPFGLLLVYALYQQYKEEGEAFLPRFMRLLEAGGSAPPGALLAELGVDIKDRAFWRKGLTLLAGMLDEYEAAIAD